MAHKSIQVGVALSGGSAWGVAHVGAIAALRKHDVPIDCIAGTSAGSVVAALYAFGLPIEKIEEAAKKMEWKQISRFAYSRLGLRTNASLAKVITDLIGEVNIEDAKIPLAIVATNIETGEKKVFREGPVAQAVCASSAIPGYFAPVEIDGTFFVDGVLSENLPLSPLSDMGAMFTIGIDLGAFPPLVRPKNFGEVLGRSFDILYRAQKRDPSVRADILIEPDLIKYNPRSFDEAEALYQEGFAATEASISGIKTKLALYKAASSSFWQRARKFFR